MSQDFSILVSKTDGELVEYSPKSLSLFPSASSRPRFWVKSSDYEIGSLLKFSSKDYAFNFESGSLFIAFGRF